MTFAFFSLFLFIHMHLVWVGVRLMAQNAPCKDRRRVWSRWLTIGLDLFCDFMDVGEVEVNENAKKRGRYPVILTEQAWSIINDYYLIIKFKVHRPRRISRGQ